MEQLEQLYSAADEAAGGLEEARVLRVVRGVRDSLAPGGEVTVIVVALPGGGFVHLRGEEVPAHEAGTIGGLTALVEGREAVYEDRR